MSSEMTPDPGRQLIPSSRQRVVKLIERLVLASLMLIVLHLLGFVGIFYVRRIDNDPFINPVEVSEVGEDRIKLKDGRLVIPHGGISDRTKVEVSAAKMRVDMEIDETNLVKIYGRHEIFVCGLGMPLVTLPLFPRSIPKYNRTLMEIGELEGLPRITEFKDCSEEKAVR